MKRFESQTWRLCVFVLGRPPPKYQNSPRSVAPQPLNVAVSSPYSNARSFLRFPSPSTIKGLFEEWKSLKTRIPLFEWQGQSQMKNKWWCNPAQNSYHLYIDFQLDCIRLYKWSRWSNQWCNLYALFCIDLCMSHLDLYENQFKNPV